MNQVGDDRFSRRRVDRGRRSICRLLSIIIALIIAFALSACGAGSGSMRTVTYKCLGKETEYTLPAFSWDGTIQQRAGDACIEQIRALQREQVAKMKADQAAREQRESERKAAQELSRIRAKQDAGMRIREVSVIDDETRCSVLNDASLSGNHDLLNKIFQFETAYLAPRAQLKFRFPVPVSGHARDIYIANMAVWFSQEVAWQCWQSPNSTIHHMMDENLLITNMRNAP